ncbi:hypothetical protein EJ02DRAFT_514227 [Clathrospora elynae]|uniref:Uncharacterized protein n=1 Tax=Clathrospora elynae TaxID=706981 RepID=A0A6A5SE33_9PLEO|nr:hypothetical protein EJ02DRAFT_514227 [Clathrospora elynae]
MSYAGYDSRYHEQRPRHESHYTRSRDTDAYPNVNSSSYPSSYHSYEGRDFPQPRRSAARPHYRIPSRKQTWPPSPSVEDERVSLAKETASSAGSSGEREGEPPINTRGTVNQESLLDDIAHDFDRRFVLVSDPYSGDDAHGPGTSRDRRRKSFAERGNMAHIRTDVGDSPMFTERVRMPYGYTKPQKESVAPSPGAFRRSPDPITPGGSSKPRSAPSRDSWTPQRDQNARPSKPKPTDSRRNSFTKSRPTTKDDLFDDSDLEPENTTHLRSERKPARYSFVKSDLQKEDIRNNVRNTEDRPESRRRDSGHRPPPTFRKGDSSASSKENSYAQSPPSSSSSLNSGNRNSRPAPVDTGYSGSSRAPSRPSSPLQPAPSPKFPSRLRESPPSSRPSSRGNPRPASPLSFSTTVRSPSPGRGRVTEADWHPVYPTVISSDKSRPTSRYGRHETMPLPRPRIDVQSPSPARPATAGPALPYPADDRLMDVFMPPEENFQFDHSTLASPRHAYSDPPSALSPSMPGSPYTRDIPSRLAKQNSTMLEESPRTRRTRSNSVRSQASQDGRRDKSTRRAASLDLDRPLPSCPRGTPSGRYDDWYSLEGYRGFDVCPSCYDGVFADTPFAVNFKQTRLYERPVERICDFSSPWTRLAWLLTIKQRLQSLDLIYALAEIAEIDRPCPGDLELSTDRASWYGIPDQRDGLHVANFAICSYDKRMIEAMFPSMRGYFTKLPTSYQVGVPDRYICSLRTTSRRFPMYLDLIVELDAEARSLGQRSDINRSILLAHKNAFMGECARDKTSIRKPWHFIPSLPEFTVCEECYDELVWPATQSKSIPPTIPRLFNKSIQLVPGEDPDVGSSCCLYSPRMRRIWEVSVKEEDFAYLKRKAVERKRAEVRLARERKGIVGWLGGVERGSREWELARGELKSLEREWASWE